jgi:hypothetical protein
MTEAIIRAGSTADGRMVPPQTRAHGTNDRFALISAGLAATVLVGSSAAVAVSLGDGVVTAMLVSLVALAGSTIGYLFARKDAAVAAKAAQLLMFRVADELAQYRAFTQLLRDQGTRIVASTSGAAMMMVAGLNEMDASVDRMRLVVDGSASRDAVELRSLIDSIAAPVISILGQLQFQDMTQQQIEFLSRLSLILDDHMLALARNLGDRRSEDRIGRFGDMFDSALRDCVTDGQRDDHHAASGVDERETAGVKVEMF